MIGVITWAGYGPCIAEGQGLPVLGRPELKNGFHDFLFQNT